MRIFMTPGYLFTRDLYILALYTCVIMYPVSAVLFTIRLRGLTIPWDIYAWRWVGYGLFFSAGICIELIGLSADIQLPYEVMLGIGTAAFVFLVAGLIAQRVTLLAAGWGKSLWLFIFVDVLFMAAGIIIVVGAELYLQNLPLSNPDPAPIGNPNLA